VSAQLRPTSLYSWHERPLHGDHVQVLDLADLVPLAASPRAAVLATHARLGAVLLVDGQLVAAEAEATIREHAVHVPLLGQARAAANLLLIDPLDPWLLGECLAHPWVTAVDLLLADDILPAALDRLGRARWWNDPRVRVRPLAEGPPGTGYDLIVDGRGPASLAAHASLLAPDGTAAASATASLHRGRWRLPTCPADPALPHVVLLRLLSAAVPGGHVALTLASREPHELRDPARRHVGRAYDPATHRAAFALPPAWRVPADPLVDPPDPPAGADPSRWWHEDIARIGWTHALPARIVESTRSAFQQIEVREHPDFGALLLLDDTVQGSTADEHVYHEMAVHVPLCGRLRVRVRALVVGGGDGGIVRELLRHPEVASVELVELDPDVIAVSRRHFDLAGALWDDPRLAVHLADGADHLAAAAAAGRVFDVIVVDATDSTGPAQRLWNDAFFRDLAACLAPDGVCVDSDMLAPHIDGSAQLSREWAGDHVLADLRRAARYFRGVEVYLSKVPLFPCGYFAHFLYTHDAASLAEPARDLAGRYYDPGIHRAAFALPPWLRALLADTTRGGAP
jgi:spermidine synthase